MIGVTFTIRGDAEDIQVVARLYDIIKRESQRVLKKTKIAVRAEEEETVEVEEEEER